MKKTLIATAVAAATLSTSTFAMENASDLAARLDSMPTIYGNIQLAYSYTDDEGAGGNGLGAGGQTGGNFFDNGTTLGIKHSHEIMPGLKAFAKLELEGVNADDKDADGDNAGLNELDEAYIGFEGSFGKVWFGTDDSTYERELDIISEYWEVGELALDGGYSTGEGNQFLYSTPSFSGFTLHTSVEVDGSEDGDTGAGANGQNTYAYQAVVTYDIESTRIALGMDSNDNADDADNENNYGLTITHGMGDLALTLEFDTRDKHQDTYGLMAQYTLGKNVFALAYQFQDDDSDKAAADERYLVSAQALHNLSDHLYVFVEGYIGEEDDSGEESSQLAVGAAYLF